MKWAYNLKHDIPGISEPLYTLYAHLSAVSVKAEGDVEFGEEVGLVGMSGSVRGSTLYFEVRYGENAYEATVNPELWLEPLADQAGNPMGALAGRIVDAEGNFVTVRNIRVENLRAAAGDELRTFSLKTYLDESQRGQSPWGESFAAGDLPEGTYRISFWHGSQRYQREVEVQPGKWSGPGDLRRLESTGRLMPGRSRLTFRAQPPGCHNTCPRQNRQ